MGEVPMECQGFNIGRWSVPPFTLRRGECATLVLPKDGYADSENLIACLIGLETVAGLSVNCRVVRAQPVLNPTGWQRWLFGCTPYRWLKKHSALSHEAIVSFLQEHHMERNLQISRYAGNERMLLGLMAAYASKPDVVVFSTTGLDPCGIRDVFQIVSEHLPVCAALNVAYSVHSEARGIEYAIFPGSLIVPVVDNEQSLVPMTG